MLVLVTAAGVIEMSVFNFTTTERSITVFYGDFLINASVGVSNNTNSETLKFHEKILLAVFAGILAFVTMVGNLLVMISFGLNKKLRIINNYFLASLSIADFSGNHSNTEIIHDIIIILRTFDEVRFALYVSGLFAEKKRSIQINNKCKAEALLIT
jgi:hypothetical protein